MALGDDGGDARRHRLAPTVPSSGAAAGAARQRRPRRSAARRCRSACRLEAGNDTQCGGLARRAQRLRQAVRPLTAGAAREAGAGLSGPGLWGALHSCLCTTRRADNVKMSHPLTQSTQPYPPTPHGDRRPGINAALAELLQVDPQRALPCWAGSWAGRFGLRRGTPDEVSMRAFERTRRVEQRAGHGAR